MPRISGTDDPHPRPVLVVLPGGKRLDDEPEVPPSAQPCPHCQEREVAHEAARLNAVSPIDEEVRLQRAKSRGGKLLD
jgi:hypothetical protein